MFIELLNLFKNNLDNYYILIHKLEKSLLEIPNHDRKNPAKIENILNLSTEYKELLSYEALLENTRHKIEILKRDNSQ